MARVDPGDCRRHRFGSRVRLGCGGCDGEDAEEKRGYQAGFRSWLHTLSGVAFQNLAFVGFDARRTRWSSSQCFNRGPGGVESFLCGEVDGEDGDVVVLAEGLGVHTLASAHLSQGTPLNLLAAHRSGFIPNHPVFVQRPRATPGVESPGRYIVRADVHTDSVCILLDEPRSHARNQPTGDAQTSFLSGNVDPLQLSLAVKSPGFVSRCEAHNVSFIDSDKDGPFRQCLLGRVFTMLVPGDPVHPKAVFSPLVRTDLSHRGNVLVAGKPDRDGHQSSLRGQNIRVTLQASLKTLFLQPIVIPAHWPPSSLNSICF